MQFIEVSITGVRSAVITLQRRESPMRILLFPMVHLGTADFYRQVTARLRLCNLVVAEGVAGRSLAVRALTLSYRLPGRGKRLDLTVQKIDFASLGIEVIRPDLDAQQFRRHWRAVPALQRLTMGVLALIIGLGIRLFGTRRYLARHLARDDLPSGDQQDMEQVLPEMTNVLLNYRDALLVQAVARIHQTRGGEPIDVAVVYGAAHMPALCHELASRYGYRARSAEWLTVFDF